MKAIFPKIKKILLPQTRFVPIIVILVGTALLLVSHPVWAGLEAVLANYLILPVAKFFGSLTVTLIGILISVAKYNNFIDVPAVQKGWILLRDVTNMLFIVILLLIAFGTLFRWDNYHYKKLLGKLLIMAVLVNFSKGITGFMIDFAQVLMLTFVYGFADAAAGNFVQGFHLDKMFQFASNQLTPEEARNLQADETSFLIAALLALISIFVAMVVIGVIVIVLIFRIVILWFLVITSPIAYTLNIFPGQGQKYAQMWWDYFGKYASTGPILAFFLWLSLSVMQITNGQAITFTKKIQDSSSFGLADVPAASITGIGQSEILLSFIVNISLLVGALWMTKQMGVAGGGLAGSAMGFLQKSGAAIAKAPFKGMKSFATFAERKLYTTTGVGLNPMRAVRAWQAYSGRKKLEEEAVGAWRAGTRAEQLFKEGKGRRAVLSLAMGAHEDLYQNYLGWRGIKRLGRTMIQPKTGIKDFEEAEEERRQMKLNLALADSKKNTDFKKVAEQAIRQEERDKMVDEKVTYAKTRRERGDNDYNYKELTEEDEEGKKKTKTVLFDEMLNKRLEQVGLTENSAQAAAGSAELHAYKQIKDKLATEWDLEKAEEDVKNDKNFNNNLETRAKQRLDSLGDAGLRNYGHEVTERKSGQLEANYEYLKGGGLTKEQTLTRDRQVEVLLAKLVKINQQIATEKAQGKDTRPLENLRDTQRSELHGLQKKFMDPSGFEYYQTTDDEKKKNLDSDTFQKTVQNAELEWNKAKGALLSDSEVKRAERAVETHKRKAEQFQVAPRAYYASRAYRALEANEDAKLPKHAMEYSELHNLIDTAMRDKDFVRISSLMKKATRDYNDNEIFNAYGYGSGPEGAEQFRKDYLVGKVGMNDQASMALMSDINYMNEELGHNNTARMYGVKGGAYYFKSPEEQAASAANENLKQDSRRFIQTHNRLGYGYEDPDGTYHLDLSGKLTLAGFQEDFIYRLGRAEVNPSFLMKLTTAIPELEAMERSGLLTAKDRDGKTISQLVKEVADKEIKRGMGRTFEGLIATAARIRNL